MDRHSKREKDYSIRTMSEQRSWWYQHLRCIDLVNFPKEQQRKQKLQIEEDGLLCGDRRAQAGVTPCTPSKTKQVR